MSHWLRILHMSDLHERVALDWMDDERKAKVHGGRASRYRVLETNLIETIEEIRNEHAIDMVCFTGDVADWGLAEEYEQATKRFDSILSAAGVPRDRLFLVPGNHDLNRKLAVPAWRELRKLSDRKVDLSKWMAGEQCPYGAKSEWRDEILKRTGAFWQWVKNGLGRGALSPKNSRHRRLGYCVAVENFGLSFPLYVIGLDSAWLAGNHDTGELLLTRRQIDLLTRDEEGKPLKGLRLALLHHPLEILADRTDSLNLLAATVDLVLHGHQHEEAIEQQMNPDRQLFVFASGSLYEGDQEDEYINSFHVMDIQTNDEGRPLSFDFQFWGWSKNGFWHPTGAIYKAAKNGRYSLVTELGKRILPKTDQVVRTAPNDLPFPYRNSSFLDVDFKDRIKQSEKTHKILRDPRKRLICIFGHPGMGKTTLAAKVLWDTENYCRDQTITGIKWDGIIYLSMKDLSFDNLFDCIKDVCSTNDQQSLDAMRRSNAGTEKIRKVLDILSSGKFIILMDGIETLLDEEGKFKTEHVKERELGQFCKKALEISSESKILLTSTKPLVTEEVGLWPRLHQERLIKGLPEKDAIARLRDLDPPGSNRLRNATDEQLAGIVTVTCGIPLALELIAHILSQKKNWCYSLEEIAAKFYHFDEVVNTLVREAYRGLDPDSKKIMEALALFDRPVSIEAICFVLESPPDSREIHESLSRLYETHLINLEWKDGDTRLFGLHPIEQSYIYYRIPDNVKGYDRRTLHKRAAKYYATKRKPREEWKDIKTDIEPQLLEFDQLLRAKEYDGAAHVMDMIDYSWYNHHKYLAYLMLLGYGTDSIIRRKELLGKLSLEQEVKNRTSLGWLYRRMGRKREGEEHFTLAVEQANGLGDAKSSIYALSEMGYFLTDNAGEHDKAEMCFKQALSISQNLEDDYSQAHVYLGLAFADFQRQHNIESLQNASKALELFKRVKTRCARYREIDCLVRLGMIHRKAGNYQSAIRTAEKGLELAEQHRLVGWKGELNSGLGFHLRAQGKFDSAIEYHKKALDLFTQQWGMKREEAVQYSYLGNLYTILGLFSDARKSFYLAEAIAKKTDLRRELSWILANSGVLYCRLGDYDKALELQQQALKILKENNHLDSQVVRFTDIAGTMLELGRLDESKNALLNAMTCAAQDEKLNLPSMLPEAYLRSPYLEDKLPHEMQSPHDHLRRGIVLTRIYLQSNDLQNALQVIDHIKNYQNQRNAHHHQTVVLHAIVFHRLGRLDEALMTYRRAMEATNDLLLKSPKNYSAKYSHGLSLSGLAAISKDEARENYSKQASEVYQNAYDMCKEDGVVKDAISIFREIPKHEGVTNLVFPSASFSTYGLRDT